MVRFDLALRVGRDHLKRMEKWIEASERYSKIQVVGHSGQDMLLLNTENAHSEFISSLCTDPVVSVIPTLCRLFPVTHEFPRTSMDDLRHILQDVMTECNRSSLIRLQGSPRCIENEIGPLLAGSLNFVPHFEKCTHVLNIIALPESPDILYLSFMRKTDFEPYFLMKQQIEFRATGPVCH